MSVSLRIQKDKDGILRADADEQRFAPIAWFLEQDVQADAQTAEDLIAECARVADDGHEWTGTGNAHTVTISASRVLVENDYVEDDTGKCEVSLEDFRDCVQAWLDAIRASSS